MTRRDYDNGLDRDGQLSSTSQDGFGQVLELLTSHGFEGMAQAMATLLTAAAPSVPAPLVTVQVWFGPVGWLRTVTA